MSNWAIMPSDSDIIHRQHKYIDKKMGKNGKWIYYYTTKPSSIKARVGVYAKERMQEKARRYDNTSKNATQDEVKDDHTRMVRESQQRAQKKAGENFKIAKEDYDQTIVGKYENATNAVKYLGTSITDALKNAYQGSSIDKLFSNIGGLLNKSITSVKEEIKNKQMITNRTTTNGGVPVKQYAPTGGTKQSKSNKEIEYEKYSQLRNSKGKDARSVGRTITRTQQATRNAATKSCIGNVSSDSGRIGGQSAGMVQTVLNNRNSNKVTSFMKRKRRRS